MDTHSRCARANGPLAARRVGSAARRSRLFFSKRAREAARTRLLWRASPRRYAYQAHRRDAAARTEPPGASRAFSAAGAVATEAPVRGPRPVNGPGAAVAGDDCAPNATAAAFMAPGAPAWLHRPFVGYSDPGNPTRSVKTCTRRRWTSRPFSRSRRPPKRAARPAGPLWARAAVKEGKREGGHHRCSGCLI